MRFALMFLRHVESRRTQEDLRLQRLQRVHGWGQGVARQGKGNSLGREVERGGVSLDLVVDARVEMPAILVAAGKLTELI